MLNVFEACQKGNFNTIWDEIIKNPEQVNWVHPESGRTLSSYAAEHGRVEILSLLLSRGANTCGPRPGAHNLLYWICRCQNKQERQRLFDLIKNHLPFSDKTTNDHLDAAQGSYSAVELQDFSDCANDQGYFPLAYALFAEQNNLDFMSPFGMDLESACWGIPVANIQDFQRNSKASLLFYLGRYYLRKPHYDLGVVCFHKALEFLDNQTFQHQCNYYIAKARIEQIGPVEIDFSNLIVIQTHLEECWQALQNTSESTAEVSCESLKLFCYYAMARILILLCRQEDIDDAIDYLQNVVTLNRHCSTATDREFLESVMPTNYLCMTNFLLARIRIKKAKSLTDPHTIAPLYHQAIEELRLCALLPQNPAWRHHTLQLIAEYQGVIYIADLWNMLHQTLTLPHRDATCYANVANSLLKLLCTYSADSFEYHCIHYCLQLINLPSVDKITEVAISFTQIRNLNVQDINVVYFTFHLLNNLFSDSKIPLKFAGIFAISQKFLQAELEKWEDPSTKQAPGISDAAKVVTIPCLEPTVINQTPTAVQPHKLSSAMFRR